MWSLFSLHQALRQRSTSLAEAQRSAQSAQTERAAVEERLRGLQRAVAMLETEKKDAERQAVRLEKDKNALRNTLDKVSTVSQVWKLFHSFICVFVWISVTESTDSVVDEDEYRRCQKNLFLNTRQREMLVLVWAHR